MIFFTIVLWYKFSYKKICFGFPNKFVNPNDNTCLCIFSQLNPTSVACIFRVIGYFLRFNQFFLPGCLRVVALYRVFCHRAVLSSSHCTVAAQTVSRAVQPRHCNIVTAQTESKTVQPRPCNILPV